jgi:hypothetical protein
MLSMAATEQMNFFRKVTKSIGVVKTAIKTPAILRATLAKYQRERSF